MFSAKYKALASVGIGLGAGLSTLLTTGDVWDSFCVAITTAGSSYLGTFIDTSGLVPLATASMNAFATALIGTPTEGFSIDMQSWDIIDYNIYDNDQVKCPASNATTINYSGYEIPISPGAGKAGMTTTDLFDVWNKTGYRPGAIH